MGPRKKTKPNPDTGASPPSILPEPSASATSLPSKTGSSQELEAPELQSSGVGGGLASSLEKPLSTGGPATPRSTSSWYGGTWPRVPKAVPSIQTAKDSATVPGEAISEISRATPKKLSLQSLSTSPKGSSLYLSPGASSRSQPLSATTTKLNISSSELSKPPINHSFEAFQEETTGKEKIDATAHSKKAEHDSLDADEQVAESLALLETLPDAQVGWLAWFSRNDHLPPKPSDRCKVSSVAEQKDASNAQERLQDDMHDQIRSPAPIPKQLGQRADQQYSRSWLGIWSKSASTSDFTTVKKDNIEAELVSSTTPAPPAGGDKPTLPLASQPTAKDVHNETNQPGWAFWPRNTANIINIEDSRSDSDKSAANGNFSSLKEDGTLTKGRKDQLKATTSSLGKRERPTSVELLEDGKQNTSVTVSKDGNTAVGVSATSMAKAPVLTNKPQAMANNLLLPSFKETYQPSETPSLLQQIGRLLYPIKAPTAKHINLVKEAPRIKKAVAIGVHGYFPAPLIRSVLGHPTGTSVKFAESAANAIQSWTQSQGYSCEVGKVALEGEGRIEERVDLLWKLMLNWIEDIRKADFILIACHSQGVPVATMLIAKLIAFGCLNGARVGICAMAGVNMGPFVDYKSRWIGGSAGELFDFARPDSRVSQDYEAALNTALKFGVKVVYIGSIDDQLVSLESSIFGIIEHPHVYRAVFVDGRVHAPDFLTHLVGFALKLRNLGISDHGLIRELSSPLAGSLYSGEGHSRIYEDPAVYKLAMEYAMETSSMGQIPLKGNKPTTTPQNPYILPFAMRGVLEEEHVRTELHEETAALLKQFDDWKPNTKVLKDVKFRLEGVRSKL